MNFCITATLARTRKAETRLRIDDLDAKRVRPEYIEDIFATLHWLGIAWHQGPKTPAESEAFSQRRRIQRYNALVEKLSATGRVYGCTCTRSAILARTGSTTYDGYCRNASHDLRQTPVLRFLSGSNQTDGDFVIRRRDMLPAYHVASLADDIDGAINLIVRGKDLESSTAAQLELARALGSEGEPFLAVDFFHHGLILDENGHKLSKTRLAARVRDAASHDQIVALARQLLQNL